MIAAMRTRHTRRRGFSLVEVMISLFVLSFGLLGVAALQINSIKSHSSGLHLSEASAVARNRIELLSRLAFTSATLTDSGAAWGNASIVTTPSQSFTRSERISDEGTELKQVEVRVVWNDRTRAGRTLVISSKKLRETDE